MFKKIAFASIKASLCTLIAASLLFTPAALAFEPAALPFIDNPLEKFTISPSSGAAGAEYFVTIFSPSSSGKFTKDTSVVPPAEMTVVNTELTTPSSLKIKLKIPTATQIGTYILLLKDKDAADKDVLIGTAEFIVTAIAPGPIPPGLDPQVDIMWGVMSKDVVFHNFGRKIANNYYGIAMRIGNNTGYDLQIAGIGFQLRKSKNDPDMEPDIEPATSYRATRGTLEREQEVGVRASVINIAKSIGNLYTGFLPFWKDTNHSANAALFGDILNGPFEAALERIYPDTTVRQLTRLDDQTLRDGLIIKNNSHVVTLTFISKRVLNLSKDSGKLEDYKDNPRKDMKIKDWKNDPQYVKRQLGALVLIGQTLAYINRVQVIKSSEGGGVTPPPTVFNPDIQVLKQGQTGVEIVFTGEHLENAKPSPPAGIELPQSDISISEDGHVLRAKASVSETIEPGDYTLFFTSTGGRSNGISIKVVAESPKDITFEPASITATDKDQEISIKVKGRFLKGSKIMPTKIENVLEVPDSGVSTSATEFTQKIKVLKNAKKDKYKLKVQGPGGVTEKEFEIK